LSIATRHLRPRRLNREAWLRGALEYLRRTGGSELIIGELAEFLAVTKGSFYHHFEGREDFIDAVLEYWHQTYNLAVRKAVEATDGGPRDRLRTIMQTVYEGEFTTYDLPMRAWAMDNQRVRRKMRQTDKWRSELCRREFAALGFRGDELEVRARMFVTYVSLEVAFYVKLSKTDLLKQIDNRLDVLTSKQQQSNG
jgi:AcrR family transcriptional regulator